ncbi:hypothetical protein HT031_001422 [Scenedesmus sp. PABB004]|nr:hypothetical protein HT031_001422 [Scenedesmus sp. PABB004]
MVLAEALIGGVSAGGDEGLPMPAVGQVVKDALGPRWLSSRERQNVGLPQFQALLAADPFFQLREPPGSGNAVVRLRTSRLAALIAAPELVAGYRARPGGTTGAPPPPAGAGGAGPAAAAAAGGAFAAPPPPPPPPPLGGVAGGPGLVAMPPSGLLLGLLADAVWDPEAGPESLAKGALAKWVLQSQLAPGDLAKPDLTYEVGLGAAGKYLLSFWVAQTRYDASVRPYRSLAELLADDPVWRVAGPSGGGQAAALPIGALVERGCGPANACLAAAADAIWPPGGGRDAFLRGSCAKWLIASGFCPAVLRTVLAVAPGTPSVFRIELAQAVEFLRRVWQSGAHPYDVAAQPPWAQLRVVLSADPLLAVEPSPGAPGAMAVVVDVAGMLAAAGSGGGGGAAAAAGSSSSAAFAAAAGSSSGAAFAAAAGSSSGSGRQPPAAAVGASQDGRGGGGAAGAPSFLPRADAQARTTAAAAAAERRRGLSPTEVAALDRREAEEDTRALQALSYEPPPDMQWWRASPSRPAPASHTWCEIAVRLLDPSSAGDDFELQVAEMVQHLEVSPLLAVAVSTYKSRPHLLQFFAPAVAIGGLELPAAAYLLDVQSHGPRVDQAIDLVRPVLASNDNTKVTHSSKQWVGQLQRVYGLRLVNQYDTQAGHYAWSCLRHEAGRTPHLTPAALRSTAEASLSALLRTADLFHPVRHREAAKDAPRIWQDRPLSEELVTCAAADVAYIIPLMESQVRHLRAAAAEVRQKQHTHGPRGGVAGSLPPELADAGVLAALAAGAEARDGCVSHARLHEWGTLAAFHQQPMSNPGAIIGRAY